MKVLLSNDDGYNAVGIHCLIEHLLQMGKLQMLSMVAPDRDRSGASNSLTLDRPLLPELIANDQLFASTIDGFDKLKHCFRLNGTPTDCVHIAQSALIEHPLDLVISGINHGANMGDDVLYSGTIAAATEGRHLGLPAIAISLAVQPQHRQQQDNQLYFATAARVLVNILDAIQEYPLQESNILNINVPNCPIDQIKGIKVTRLGRRHRSEPAIRMLDPRGRDVYWLGPVGPHADAGEGTDFFAIEQNYISVTPLSIDQTDYQRQSVLEKWLANSFF